MREVVSLVGVHHTRVASGQQQEMETGLHNSFPEAIRRGLSTQSETVSHEQLVHGEYQQRHPAPWPQEYMGKGASGMDPVKKTRGLLHR